MKIFLLAVSLLALAGCSQTTGVAAACAAFGKPITYDSSRDTRETVRQIRVKNGTFKGLRCF